jgi:hypothetical protein
LHQPWEKKEIIETAGIVCIYIVSTVTTAKNVKHCGINVAASVEKPVLPRTVALAISKGIVIEAVVNPC